MLGPTIAGEGWRPDRLHPATADDPGDVGKCYVSTAGLREPIIAKVHRHDPGVLSQRATGRALAGVPAIDPESWHAARSRRAARSSEGLEALPVGGPEVDHRSITDILAVFGADRRLWTEEIRTRLVLHDADRYSTWTADESSLALRPLAVSVIQINRAGTNRNGYDRDAITTAYGDLLGRP